MCKGGNEVVPTPYKYGKVRSGTCEHGKDLTNPNRGDGGIAVRHLADNGVKP